MYKYIYIYARGTSCLHLFQISLHSTRSIGIRNKGIMVDCRQVSVLTISCLWLVSTALGQLCSPDVNGTVDFSGKISDLQILNVTFSGCVQYAANITALDLAHNSIDFIGAMGFYAFYQLEILNLSNNNIQDLNKYAFVGLRNLRILDMRNNQLRRLEAGLIDLVKLHSVFFNNNTISEVEPGIVSDINEGLMYFDMRYNSMTSLDPWMYKTYQSNTRQINRFFNFQYNNIAELTNYMNWTFDLTYPYEVNVEVQFNNVQTFSLDKLRQFDPNATDASLFPLMLTLYMNITNNPFVCDCHVYSLAHVIRSGVLRYSRVDEYRYRCDSPANTAGWDYIHDLAFHYMVCNHTIDCPSGCFCQERPHNDTLFIDCRGQNLQEMPEKIPDTKMSKVEMFLDDNNIRELKQTSYSHLIYNISLQNNKIETLDSAAVTILEAKQVNLKNNRITTIPKEVQKFDAIQLSGNPLTCDCDSLWIKQWMEVDKNNADPTLKCTAKKTGEQTILSMTQRSLGCTNELLIYMCVALGVVLALVIAVLTFAKRCPYKTKVVLHKYLAVHLWDNPLVDNVSDKDVDLYLVFDENDTEVVGYIRYFGHRLNQTKPCYSILNPQRFMDSGGAQENIFKYIGKSKRVVVFLSKGIFNNDERLEEISDAEHRQVEEIVEDGRLSLISQTAIRLRSRNSMRQDEPANLEQQYNVSNAPKIIYVIYNDDPSLSKKLEKEPWKTRLADKTVLRPDPDDKWFWAKMRYELPRTGNGNGEGNYNPHGDTRNVPEVRVEAGPGCRAIRPPRNPKVQPSKYENSRVQVHNIYGSREAMPNVAINGLKVRGEQIDRF